MVLMDGVDSYKPSSEWSNTKVKVEAASVVCLIMGGRGREGRRAGGVAMVGKCILCQRLAKERVNTDNVETLKR